jgi:hypothetical protein
MSSQLVAAYSPELKSRGDPPLSLSTACRASLSIGAESPRSAELTAPGKDARRNSSRSPETSAKNSSWRVSAAGRRRPLGSVTRPRIVRVWSRCTSSPRSPTGSWLKSPHTRRQTARSTRGTAAKMSR